MCLCAHAPCTQVPTGESVGWLGAGVTSDCDLSSVVAGKYTWVLWKWKEVLSPAQDAFSF